MRELQPNATTRASGTRVSEAPALRIAHRGYVMENGRIVTSDSAENLLKSEDVRSAYLGM